MHLIILLWEYFTYLDTGIEIVRGALKKDQDYEFMTTWCKLEPFGRDYFFFKFYVRLEPRRTVSVFTEIFNYNSWSGAWSLPDAGHVLVLVVFVLVSCKAQKYTPIIISHSLFSINILAQPFTRTAGHETKIMRFWISSMWVGYDTLTWAWGIRPKNVYRWTIIVFTYFTRRA